MSDHKNQKRMRHAIYPDIHPICRMKSAWKRRKIAAAQILRNAAEPWSRSTAMGRRMDGVWTGKDSTNCALTQNAGDLMPFA
jgi:hypothetical protein